MNNFFDFLEEINEETKKSDVERVRELIFRDIVDKNDLKLLSGKKKKSKNMVVRGKEGLPSRLQLADKIFDEISKELKEFKPERGFGGAGRSDKAPNIEFENGVKVVFAPTEGTRPAGAEEYEKAIVNGWNYLIGGEPDLEVHPDTEETGMDLASTLKEKENVPEEKAEWLGGKSMKEVSDFWKEHMGSNRPNKTPKTDLMIGDHRVSLKMGKDAQLATPKVVKAEGEALFYSAAEDSNLSEEIMKEFDEFFELDEEGISKLGRNRKEYELKGGEYFKVNHYKLTDKLRKLVSNNDEFSYYLTREAMTGEKKFGRTNNEEAIAEYLMVGSFSGDKLQYHKIEEDYVRYIASQLNVYVAWKSAGGSKYAVMRLTGPKTKFENKIPASRLLDEEDNYVTISLRELDEFANSLGIEDNRLDEGIKDIFKWVKDKVRKIAEKGIDNLLKLFRIEIDSVDILGNENINFWE
jgi:hypothetical protein